MHFPRTNKTIDRNIILFLFSRSLEHIACASRKEYKTASRNVQFFVVDDAVVNDAGFGVNYNPGSSRRFFKSNYRAFFDFKNRLEPGL